jgi:hypothetical protein
MGDAATAFFDRREHELAAAAMRSAAQFAADAASEAPGPFWLARAAGSDDADIAGSEDAAALARDPAVIAAFQDLRRRPTIRLRQPPSAVFTRRPAVRGLEIVLDEHVRLPDWPDGLRYLRNVDLVALTRLAPNFADVGELYEAFARTNPEVILPDFLGALSVLIARGALERAE